MRRRPKVEKAKDPRKAISLMWNNLKHYKFRIFLIFILVILTGSFSLVSPYLMSIIIDRYIAQANFTGLSIMSAVLLVIFIFRSLFSFFQQFEMIRVSQNTLKRIRVNLFSHIQNLAYSTIDKMKKGDLLSRISNDVENINNFLTSGFSELASNIIFIIGTVIAMLLLNWKLALVSLSVIPLITILTIFLTNWTRKVFRQHQKVVGELSSFLEENLVGIKTIKSFGYENNANYKFEILNNKARGIEFKAELASLILPPTLHALSGIGIGLIVLLGSLLVMNEHATIGALAGIIVYTRRFFHPFRALASLYNQLQSALAGSERIKEIHLNPGEKDYPQAEEIDQISGDIKLENINFSYDKVQKVLKNVDITVQHGRTIALVGPTGAGKTTVVKLISRFYEPDSGEISIDHRNFKQIKKISFREKLSVVLQEPFIFSRSIRDNLKYANSTASDQEMIESCKIANVHHFIEQLPDKYDTVISEESSNISAGQKQLLSIARAILADRPITILDEATSNVDTLTEKKIQEALKHLSKNRTNIVIAHRLSTIKNADLIVVIDHGEIVEAGNHQELMSKQGYYYKMYLAGEDY